MRFGLGLGSLRVRDVEVSEQCQVLFRVVEFSRYIHPIHDSLLNTVERAVQFLTVGLMCNLHNYLGANAINKSKYGQLIVSRV
jgi:hypothetical protein